MTDDELLQLCESATPGPWGFDLNHHIAQIQGDEWGRSIAVIPPLDLAVDDQARANAELLAAAREAIPRLIEEKRKAEQRAKKLTAFWHDLVGHFGFGGALELDGGTFEDMAEKHGLIRWLPYNPEEFSEEEREWIEAEPGELIWLDSLGPDGAVVGDAESAE